VADACRLRDDLLYACRQRQRTSLVTAANEGDLRLFCARHVVLEVVEHAPRWAREGNVALEDFLTRWRDEYLPVIRVVEGDDELVAMLDPIERERIEQLRHVDSDDVASAALAMLLEAFYLSRDTRALRAAYGDRLNLDQHESRLEMLQVGSDAGQLARMGRAALALTGGLSTSARVAVKRLVRATGPWVIISLVGLVSIAAVRTSAERRRRLLDTGSAALQVLTDTYRARAHLLSRLRRATPDAPSWSRLVSSNEARLVLARACLHVLARSHDSNMSAVKLAADLPALGIAQSAPKVRQVLRETDCFAEVWRGYWQVGRVHASLDAEDDLQRGGPES
jgi:predicted nucleic acid-binding protein